MLKTVSPDIAALKALDDRLRWLSAWTIHHANHVRESADGLKVGGHQASCASMTAIMAALYFHALSENDRVAVKPHAGPVLHAIHYLLGSQTREALENFRGFGGAQSYPSRTKDKIPVDFSTGSVGLGVAITLFASLVQDYLTAHGWLHEKDRGRWNDYGIGLLLQGHLKAAEAAFLAVTRIDPKYADGWVNIARCRLQEGNVAGAREVLDKALTLAPVAARVSRVTAPDATSRRYRSLTPSWSDTK
jgi:pyruvate dehydrogenase complex dehydrogenase (E1) component